MPTTPDRNDPRLTRGIDEQPVEQAPAYLVDQGAGAFVRPVRTAYVHTGGCGALTTMNIGIAETYARDPKFYGSTYCVGCRMHRVVDEFDWEPARSENGVVPADQRVVGS
jgi:hypothetical protein